MIRTMLCKDREVQSFEYTEARKAYFTEQMICEILMALEQTAMSFDMEYDDRQKAMSTDLSKAARKSGICDIRTRDWNHSNPQLKTILSSFAVCNRKTDEGLSEKVP